MAYLIGIAGGSGAGKTTLAHALSVALDNAPVVPMDAYYRDLGYLDAAARGRCNFDTPEAFDWPPFAADIRALRRGDEIHRPSYDFVTHTRCHNPEIVVPKTYVIVEGRLVLHDAEIRTLLDTTVYVEADAATALHRRVTRDQHERGRRASDVRAQFSRYVQPMHERYVQPTARWATLRVTGTDRLDLSVQRVVAHLDAPLDQV